MQEFNFFKILEKDNKELIHSAFIAFLIDTDKHFIKHFLHKTIDEFELSELEKSFVENNNKTKKLRIRVDIALMEKGGGILTIIENKFKSFPTQRQLDDYDKVFRSLFGKADRTNKVLFCFDKNIVSFNSDWKIYDYGDLLIFLKQNYDLSKADDHSIFIRHYVRFLENYIEQYRQLHITCYQLFSGNPTNENKFWIRLLNSQIAIQFENEFAGEHFDFQVNPGNTSVPLLNILPLNWKHQMGEELLIQLQGKDLKFYLHSASKSIANNIISHCRTRVWHGRIEMKVPTKKNEKSCFIFKMKISEHLSDNFTYEELYQLIRDFYIKTNQIIVGSYNC